MASLHTNNRPDSSNAFGVAQTTRPSNPTMERNTQTSVLIIANAHLPDSWISPKKANYAGRQDLPHNSLSQPSTESPHSVNLMRFIPDTGKPHPGYCYPHPTLPLWRFCSMAGKGLGSKRVEDVKMNRIDKLRAGRKRRAGRRPFVFKSSPLAEGQGVGRLTQFYANTGRNTIRISRSSDPSSPTTKRWLDESQLEKPMTFPSLDRTNARLPIMGNLFTEVSLPQPGRVLELNLKRCAISSKSLSNLVGDRYSPSVTVDIRTFYDNCRFVLPFSFFIDIIRRS
ncbi:hypothetical protein PCASD_12296 [Puccinia coronata f. sp. avenae]|uniref:Uncharacterized protein n=1 Tax=Puccinia coronata f. sp. avenae TaxID=200324 RepID=A0A2N5URB4_9BASI|nr:hypothetical protein PCASD_25460 [Puccinia coronata f. sp. avenae]PLW40186.1 hypothetical protein PCASD_12296 [Puccinia coronata f. sp. avenae]